MKVLMKLRLNKTFCLIIELLLPLAVYNVLNPIKVFQVFTGICVVVSN